MKRWISRFIKKKLDPIDFSVLKTDIHSHLIPGIDDGSQTIDESIELISGLKDLGFSKLITTPHIMSDFYRNNSEIINDGLYNVRNALKKNNLDIPIEAAAEYYIDFEFQKRIKKKEFLVFGEKYILVELPFIDEPQGLHEIIFNLQLNGYNIVLAHPERYSYYTIKDYQSFVEKGIFLQINLLSLVGYYSDEVKKKSELLVRNNLVSFVGTDCHNIRHIKILKECFTNPIWHNLIQSGRLLNNSL